eukprot:SAG11_NODE_36943_length_259_cov_0.643750_2_plen_24_part_01
MGLVGSNAQNAERRRQDPQGYSRQ